MDKRDSIDFDNGQVGALFRKLLIPTLLGTLSMSAMTAIDGIFIGHGVGSNGVAAVNIICPIYLIFSGFGLMVGSGCSVAVSIHLARQKTKVARLNVTQALVFATLITAIICLFAMLFPEWSARLLGSSETLLPQTSDYLFWLMPSFIFQMWSLIGLFVIRLDGSPNVAMWCNIIAAALNIILDYIMIFLFGWGVKGAAIATSISIISGGIIALAYLFFYANTLKLVPLKFSRNSLLLSLRNIGYHCRIGFSSLLGEITLAVLIFMGNLMFMKYLGDDGVAAFGIACYYTLQYRKCSSSICATNYQLQLRSRSMGQCGTGTPLDVSYLVILWHYHYVAVFASSQLAGSFISRSYKRCRADGYIWIPLLCYWNSVFYFECCHYWVLSERRTYEYGYIIRIPARYRTAHSRFCPFAAMVGHNWDMALHAVYGNHNFSICDFMVI